MRHAKDSFNSSAARCAFPALWGGLCAAIVSAPALAAHAHSAWAAALYALFSRVCHQIPDRSFLLDGHPFAVCHRCFGIYLGLFLGSLPAPSLYCNFLSLRWRRAWVAGAAAPLLLDALLPYLGLWTNTLWGRFGTGLVFGIMASSLLVSGLAELRTQGLWAKMRCCASHLNGGP